MCRRTEHYPFGLSEKRLSGRFLPENPFRAEAPKVRGTIQASVSNARMPKTILTVAGIWKLACGLMSASAIRVSDVSSIVEVLRSSLKWHKLSRKVALLRCTVKRCEVGSAALRRSMVGFARRKKRRSSIAILTRSAWRVALVLLGVVARHPCLRSCKSRPSHVLRPRTGLCLKFECIFTMHAEVKCIGGLCDQKN